MLSLILRYSNAIHMYTLASKHMHIMAIVPTVVLSVGVCMRAWIAASKYSEGDKVLHSYQQQGIHPIISSSTIKLITVLSLTTLYIEVM